MLVLVWHIVGTTPRTLLTYFSTSVPLQTFLVVLENIPAFNTTNDKVVQRPMRI